MTLVPSGGLTQNFYLVSLIEARRKRPKEANSRLRMWCETCGGVALDRCADHRLSHLSHVLQGLTTLFATHHSTTATMLQERVREEGEKVLEVREAMEELERASSYVREKLEERLERSSLHQATVTSLLQEVNQMERKMETVGSTRTPESPLYPALTGSEISESGSLGHSTGSEGSSLRRSISSVESYGSNTDKAGYGSVRRSCTLDRYGSGLERYGFGSDKVSSSSDKFEYGLGSDKFTSTSDKLTSALDKFSSSPERSKSLPEKYNTDLGSTQSGLEGKITGLTTGTGLDRHNTGLERSNSSPAKYQSDPGKYSPDKRDGTDKLENMTERHVFGSEKQAQGPENARYGLDKTVTALGTEYIEKYNGEFRKNINFETEDNGIATHGCGYELLPQGPVDSRFGLEKTATGPEMHPNTRKLTGKVDNDLEKAKAKMRRISRDSGEMEGKILLLKACLSSLRDVEGKVEELEALGEKGEGRERWEREDREFTCDSLINMFERVVRVLEDV